MFIMILQKINFLINKDVEKIVTFIFLSCNDTENSNQKIVLDSILNDFYEHLCTSCTEKKQQKTG